MKLRSFFYAIAAGVSVLLLTSIAGFFWLTAQSPVKLLRGGAITNPSAAIFVPKQAPIVASLLVNPERLETFRQVVARPVNRRRSRNELKQLENSILGKQGIDYRRDLRPWLGDEITVAVTSLDFDRDPQNSAQPGYLLAATTKNPQRAKEFLQLFYSKQATAGTTDLVFEQYKGVNLIYKRPESLEKSSTGLPETLTGAVVGDRFVLFANHPKVMREAINNVQVANLSLNDDPVYQQKLETLTEPRIGLSFINLPALAAWVSQQPAPTNDALTGSETLAVALSLNRLGLLAQTALVSSQPSSETLTPTLNQPVAALQYIPNNSLLSLAGTDLNQFWNRLSTGQEGNDTLKPLIERAIASLQSRWDLDLPETIFSWVQGEYAISALPRPDKTDPDWIFVAQKTANAQESIENLDTLAKQRGLSVGTLPLADKTITAWTKLVTSTTVAGKDKMMRLEAQVAGCHTTVGDYEIFTSSIEAMSEAMMGSENSLIKNDNFKEAIATLPEPNDGYLYLDWLNGQQLVNNQLPIVQVAELVAKPLFDHLRSLSISSYGINQGVQRSQLFFRLDNHN
ncbi:MAG: DUF3352 domain-containing protein [Coleofasciculaceae cyanobacterium]